MNLEVEEEEVPDQHLFLEELYVSRCKDTQEEPTREEFMHFSGKLKTKVFGKSMILRRSHLGSAAASTIAKFCRNRTDLVKLDLYCNTLRDQGLSIISHFIRLNKGIKIINVGCNDLSDKSHNHLASMILSNHVYSLQIGIVDKPSRSKSISHAALAVSPDMMISRSMSSMKAEIQVKPGSSTIVAPDLKSKALHPNNISTITLSTITDAIIKSPYFQILGVSSCNFGNKHETAAPPAEKVLVKLLSQSSSLKHLAARNCSFEQQTCLEIISDGLMFNSTLTRLDLSANWFGTQFGIDFAEYLLTPTNRITKLPDPKNKKSKMEWEKTNDLSRLFYIDLSASFFTPEVAPKFARVVEFTQYLGYLDLSDNNLGDEGAVLIAKALEKNQTLVELHLSNCLITSVAGIAFAEALIKNDVLTTLNISRNKLGDETADALARVLPDNRTITTLNVSTAMITNIGGVAIATAAKDCPSLINIDMGNNFFSEEIGASFEQIFKLNTHILKINVSGTQINHFSFHALNEICQRNAALLKRKKKQPVRNTYLQVRYISGELKRKDQILKGLVRYNQNIEYKIDGIQAATDKMEEERKLLYEIQKQIAEKKQALEQGKEENEKKFKEMELELSIHTTEEIRLENIIASNKKQIREKREENEKKIATLNARNFEYKEQINKMNEEISALEEATKHLEELAGDPKALSKLQALPEFLVFPDAHPVEKKVIRRKESLKEGKVTETLKTPEGQGNGGGVTKKKETPLKRKSTLKKIDATPKAKRDDPTPKAKKSNATPKAKNDKPTPKTKSGKVSRLNAPK